MSQLKIGQLCIYTRTGPHFQNRTSNTTWIDEGAPCMLVGRNSIKDSWLSNLALSFNVNGNDTFAEVLIGDKIYFVYEEHLRPLDGT